MFLSFLITSLGFFFVHRLQEHLSKFFSLSTRQKFVLSLFLALFFAVIFYFLHDRPLFLWITVFIFLLTMLGTQKWMKSAMEERLKEVALEFIDHCCLSTLSGLSFRSSAQRVFLSRNDWCAKQFRNLVENLTETEAQTPLNSVFLSEFRQELTQIDRSGQKTAEQLQSLRKILKIEIGFRRRSGQVLRHLRIQSIVLLLLYLLFILFISSQIDLFQYPRLLSVSLVLFSIGLISTLGAGRRLRWKV